MLQAGKTAKRSNPRLKAAVPCAVVMSHSCAVSLGSQAASASAPPPPTPDLAGGFLVTVPSVTATPALGGT